MPKQRWTTVSRQTSGGYIEVPHCNECGYEDYGLGCRCNLNREIAKIGTSKLFFDGMCLLGKMAPVEHES